MSTELSAAGWLHSRGKPTSLLGEKASTVIGELYRGIYHIERPVLNADWSNRHEVSICVPDNQFSTYDDSLLTDIVLLAHKHNVRVTVRAAAHGYLRLIFVNVTKNGFFRDGHPTTDELIEKLQTR